MFTIAPLSWRAMTGTAKRAISIIEVTLTRMAWSQASRSTSPAAPGGRPMPTLFTSTSRRPQRSTAAATAASQSPGFDTSAPNSSASPPSSRIIATVSAAAFGSTSVTSTAAPRLASRMEAARPLPMPVSREPPPVTIAARPAKSLADAVGVSVMSFMSFSSLRGAAHVPGGAGLPSLHHRGQPGRDARKGDDEPDDQEFPEQERKHAPEDVAHGHIGRDAAHDEDVHAHGRGDERHLGHDHHEHAQPDRVDAQRLGDREDERDREDRHAEHVEEGPEHDIHDDHEEDELQPAHPAVGDEIHQHVGDLRDGEEARDQVAADDDRVDEGADDPRLPERALEVLPGE